MIWYLALIPVIALLFYAALPGIGAFRVRARWREFRRTVDEASRYPTANAHSVTKERNAFIGLFRFFGTLEAIQGDNRIWITNGRFSVAADLRNVHVYLIPEGEAPGEATGEGGPGEARAGDSPAAKAEPSDAELRSMPWSRIFSLPEGTPVFVAGALFSEEGRGLFRGYGRARLLVVIHDCPRESILETAIRSGRQRNEYMNPFTLPSVAIGSLSLIVLAYSMLTNPEARIIALIALSAGLAPVSPFLPPGFPLYFAYRRMWKKARLLRIQRDLARLPLRYFPAGAGQNGEPRRTTMLPDREPYIMIRGRMETDAAGPGAQVGAEIRCADGQRIPLPPDMRKLTIDLPRRARPSSASSADECVVFGRYSEDGGRITILKPEDPMADRILVPGDPEMISATSGHTARFYELASGAFIVLNVAINLPLMFILLLILIR